MNVGNTVIYIEYKDTYKLYNTYFFLVSDSFIKNVESHSTDTSTFFLSILNS